MEQKYNQYDCVPAHNALIHTSEKNEEPIFIPEGIEEHKSIQSVSIYVRGIYKKQPVGAVCHSHHPYLNLDRLEKVIKHTDAEVLSRGILPIEQKHFENIVEEAHKQMKQREQKKLIRQSYFIVDPSQVNNCANPDGREGATYMVFDLITYYNKLKEEFKGDADAHINYLNKNKDTIAKAMGDFERIYNTAETFRTLSAFYGGEERFNRYLEIQKNAGNHFVEFLPARIDPNVETSTACFLRLNGNRMDVHPNLLKTWFSGKRIQCLDYVELANEILANGQMPEGDIRAGKSTSEGLTLLIKKLK